MKWIGIIPVFYVNKIGKYYSTHGASYGFFIKIRKDYKNDIGLLAHEYEHVKQFWWRGFLIHKYLYKFWKYYRFKCELRAYIKQWQMGSKEEYTKNLFVTRIYLGYKLGYSREYILEKFNEGQYK